MADGGKGEHTRRDAAAAEREQKNERSKDVHTPSEIVAVAKEIGRREATDALRSTKLL